MPGNPSSTASIRGLREADAQARLKSEGYNELPRPDQRTMLRIILEVLREPMMALLLGGGVIYLALGDPTEVAFRRPNAALAAVLLTVAAVLSRSLFWPFARTLFRFGPLHVDDLAVTVGAGA